MLTRTRSLSVAAAAGAVALGGVAAGVGATAHAGTARHVHASSIRVVGLVADTPGHAAVTDPKLVNPWGLAAGPSTPLWAADNGTSTSTLYQGALHHSPISKVPLDVAIPGGGAPTGVVFNPTGDFVLSHDGKSGPALFVFAGENGDISAWNKTGDTTKAVLVAHTRKAVYKGLTMVNSGGKSFLLAADFHHGRIDVFDSHFHRVDMQGAFRGQVPRGYAPFGIARLGGVVYVTYAQQDPTRHDDVAGPGHGFVEVFDQSGHFLRTLVSRGPLDSPWGLAVAPSGFGRYGGALLVGNFGDGRIHVVDRHSGRVIATLTGRDHRPVTIDGLWGLLPGNGTAGERSDVWFSAGPGDESHGLLGVLHAEGWHGHGHGAGNGSGGGHGRPGQY